MLEQASSHKRPILLLKIWKVVTQGLSNVNTPSTNSNHAQGARADWGLDRVGNNLGKDIIAHGIAYVGSTAFDL